jgi:hypothetical protein
VSELIVTEAENNVRPTALGRYPLTFTTVNGTKTTVEMLVLEDTLLDIETEAIYAKSFLLLISEVNEADYVALASAKAYTIINGVTIANEVVVMVENDIRPTKSGVYPLTFTTANGTKTTVEMLVIGVDDQNNNTEIIFANNFAVTEAVAMGTDYVTIANVKAYNIENRGNVYPVSVSLEGEKPVTIGLHEVTFTTIKETKKVVNGLITNQEPINNEALIASNTEIMLDKLATADLIALTNAKGYDITDMDNFVEIPVMLMTEKPTTVGIHPLRFETSKGAFAEVKLTVLATNPSFFNINGKDVTLELHEVKNAEQQNNLEAFIIGKTEAVATYYNGIETVNVPVTIATEKLKNLAAIGKHEIQVTATIEATLSTFSSQEQSAEPLATQKTLTVLINVIADSKTVVEPKLPTTGQKVAEMIILGALVIIASIIMLILLIIKTNKANTA